MTSRQRRWIPLLTSADDPLIPRVLITHLCEHISSDMRKWGAGGFLAGGGELDGLSDVTAELRPATVLLLSLSVSFLLFSSVFIPSPRSLCPCLLGSGAQPVRVSRSRAKVYQHISASLITRDSSACCVWLSSTCRSRPRVVCQRGRGWNLTPSE